jgi:asparagine synthase (glutamine-hydrolysing)
MCGISGLVAANGSLAPGVARSIGPMTRALQHRGPDGDGFYQDESAALGHRRLAIIDRAHGAQPLTNETRTLWIVFNGEIYNHRGLRRQLETKGHHFATSSDTEVILHAYEEFGPSCVERLEGMFAFAIYDTQSHELFAARDRVGKKPFYYAQFGYVFHFASEIKSIACSPLWDDTVDDTALEGYLSFGYILAPDTIYKHVKKLPPGQWLRWKDGRIETRQYWDIVDFDTDARDPKTLSKALEDVVAEAVAERLESEVPLGSFLSGGIDSGIVVSLMAELLHAPPITVSVGFGDHESSELNDAWTTAHHVGTQHHAHLVEPVLQDVLDPIVQAFDEPFADSSAIPTYFVSMAARRHVTVALTGDGGDEAFGGYDLRYFPHGIEDMIRAMVPGRIGRQAFRWLGHRWPRHQALPRFMRLGSMMENLAGDPAEAYYRDLCFMKPSGVRQLLGVPLHDLRNSPVFDAVTAPYRQCPSTDALQRVLYADVKTYLPNDVLVKVDRMSMMHGLEVRCPLLDRRVLEFAFRVRSSRKIRYPYGKRLLRDIARRRLSAECARRPKRGFDAPVQQWTEVDYAPQLEADIFGPESSVKTMLDSRVMRTLYDEHRQGVRDHSFALWAIWMLERWQRTRHLRGHAATDGPRPWVVRPTIVPKLSGLAG